MPIPTQVPVSDRRVVAQGEVFEIKLKDNWTTGNVWEVAEIDEQIVRLQGEEYVPGRNPEKLCGKGGTFVFRLQAVAKGQTTLKLGHHRPGQKDVDPYKSVFCQVVVQ